MFFASLAHWKWSRPMKFMISKWRKAWAKRSNQILICVSCHPANSQSRRYQINDKSFSQAAVKQCDICLQLMNNGRLHIPQRTLIYPGVLFWIIIIGTDTLPTSVGHSAFDVRFKLILLQSRSKWLKFILDYILLSSLPAANSARTRNLVL